MAGKIKLPHTCPKCKKVTATNEAELREKFGLRTMNDSVTNQSWCKKCRAEK